MRFVQRYRFDVALNVHIPLSYGDEKEVNSLEFNATSQEDWYNHLNRLLTDKDLRTEMGKGGRLFAVKGYSLAKHARLLADTLNGVSDEFLARNRH